MVGPVRIGPSLRGNNGLAIPIERHKDAAGEGTAPRIPALLVLLLVALLGACDDFLSPILPARERYYALYSPNGEPLSGGPLGRPSCKDALSGWYDRVAATHGGTIDLTTFLADTRRQFAAMDLDHDGLITPAELSSYRAPYAVAVPRDPKARPSELGRRRPEDSGVGADRADPVMIADVTLRNQVSLPDFLAYENRKFAELNTSHTGVLRREEVLATCNVAR